ncbi:MAG: molybdopterin-dependent oxidoreductase [Candidatus Aminicenantes bacterium]|jgi:isoquinoline 1-oxidoreductase
MEVTRREFLKSLGSSCLLYVVAYIPGQGQQSIDTELWSADNEDIECRFYALDTNYFDCFAFHEDGRVTVFTGRTEMGQGLRTVLTALVTQGLDIPSDRLTIILGNPDVCPDHGPTVGSSATEQVAWGIWEACFEIRKDIIRRAAKSHGMSVKDLDYKGGVIRSKRNPKQAVNPVKEGKRKIVYMAFDPQASSSNRETPEFKDLGLFNVDAESIVTGTLKYAGDLKLPGTFYADWYISPYHWKLTRLKSVDLAGAQATSGVVRAERIGNKVAVIAKRYKDVVKAISRVKAVWEKPQRSKALHVENEIRRGAILQEIKEQTGNVDTGLASSYKRISETYRTHFTAWAPIETYAALANMNPGGNEVTIWSGSQYPHRVRELASPYLNLPESSIHFINTPIGGAFGGKVAPPVSQEAADLSRRVGAPVKIIYSRKNQFQMRGLYKQACVFDFESGVGTDGRLQARKLDIYQDLGEGTRDTYAAPHILIKHYKTEMPFYQANTRGTSYVQIGFAQESHMDMVAEAVGYDPFEFRRINVAVESFVPLVDACAAMIQYPRSGLGPDEGIGIGLCNHGIRQMGVAAAHVRVDRKTGMVHVKEVCLAVDIGTVINQHTATATLRGGIIWGLGWILREEIKLDGHSVHTEYLTDYGVPRFSDTPAIRLQFLNNESPGRPRGCGELPVIPTVAAIANAVYHAIGVRFHTTPITPEKVLKALGET